MADILFLAHRVPYPPDRGDKIRSYHILKHLTARHRVHLGTFADDDADVAHADALR
ncbi:MAG TPA: glycosyl transferase family 1, partial [Sphingomonas sp.]